MQGTSFLLILLTLHCLSCFICFFFTKTSKKDVMLYFPIALLIPVFGLLLSRIAARTSSAQMETPVSLLYKEEEKEAVNVSTGRAEPDAVVPFDEVLLLSNDKSRREVMMHILRRDPFRYLEMLKTAKVSTDVEVTHYATTTIMEIQRDLDIAMQKAEEQYNSAKNNLDVVNRFISALTSYLDTGLLLENRQKQLRFQLLEVLEHKLSIFKNSRSAHLLLINNTIRLGNFSRATEVAAMMRENWPSDEKAWLNSLHVCMAAGNAKEKTHLSELIKTATITWSRAGRNEMEFLCN